MCAEGVLEEVILSAGEHPEPLGRVVHQEALDEVLCVGGNAGAHPVRAALDLLERLHLVVRSEGRLPVQHLVCEDAERPPEGWVWVEVRGTG